MNIPVGIKRKNSVRHARDGSIELKKSKLISDKLGGFIKVPKIDSPILEPSMNAQDLDDS